ncbi:Thioesterase [Penicillium herquei]|nr:Thioesterase [Penicillium herquei]
MKSLSEPDILSLLNQSSTSTAGIIAYPEGSNASPVQISYSQLRDWASQKAAWLLEHNEYRQGGVTLVHFKHHLDNIVWFWASILAGSVPALSPPLVNTSEGRQAHFKHLHTILEDPLVLTRSELLQSEFGENDVLRVIPVESDRHVDSKQGSPINRSLSSSGEDSGNGPSTSGSWNWKFPASQPVNPQLEDVAVLMLTSGSSGHAKAVGLTHEQIFAALRGKLTAIEASQDAAVLNWIGLDHVASLTEVHLLAMYAGVTQVQVQAVEVLGDPLHFLRLLSKHDVWMSFAPDFFLRKLLAKLDEASSEEKQGIDLSKLKVLTSGGELNNVDTGVRVTEYLQKLGAKPSNIIIPGFGMTEICAGAIFNRKFPEIDRKALRESGVLGTPVPGIEMRVTPLGTAREVPSNDLSPTTNDAGLLELRGPIVFPRYFNNDEATNDAFTEDGWFKTGDLATIDSQGQLHLAGRLKELININSVKYLPYEIEEAIEYARIPGVAPSFVACFSYKETTISPEKIFVVYQQDYEADDTDARIAALHAIVRTVVLVTSSRPLVLPLPPGILQKTTLGKLSRPKISNALTEGKYAEYLKRDHEAVDLYRKTHISAPRNDTEKTLMSLFKDTIGLDIGMDIDMPILDTGISSVELMKLKRSAELTFEIKEIPMLIILSHTTIRSLADAIQKFKGDEYTSEYDPVVTLQPHGSKTPLWLFHPGVGEVLVFMALAQYFPDRPVYAFRPRGFNPGEQTFRDRDELVDTYYAALRKKQPHGPYALAGYSYGSVLAFEISKQLEAIGEDVKFLASFNLPPHIRDRMRKLDWTAGLVHIAFFCQIITEDHAEAFAPVLRGLPEDEQIDKLLAQSDPVRTAELGLTHDSLHTWVNVAFSLQKIGWNYDPSGSVSCMDVFFCQPLKDVASSREEYRYEKLNHWIDFVRDDLKYHEVGGEHYTMIGPEHVPKFQQTLKNVMAARGL